MPRRKSSADKPRANPALLRALGAHLRRLRLDRQLSQEALAELSGLNYKHIGRVELGKAEPGADVLVRLARGLSVPVGELFVGLTTTSGTPVTPVAPARLPAADVDAVKAALNALSTAIDRLLSHQPRPGATRAPRRSRR